MVSGPVAVYFPGAVCLTDRATNFAFGKPSMSSQTLRLASVSPSALPRSIEPRSTSNSAFVASGFAGSNATVASKRLNCPSTGTFICLVTKRIELLVVSTFFGTGASPYAAGRAKSRPARTSVFFMRRDS